MNGMLVTLVNDVKLRTDMNIGVSSSKMFSCDKSEVLQI